VPKKEPEPIKIKKIEVPKIVKNDSDLPQAISFVFFVHFIYKNIEIKIK